MSGIRVIGGDVKGRKLQRVPGDSTRPITDRVKENLFNILGDRVHGATVLDLFAGTGSVGIEALSRGARFVRFVDRHPAAIRTIQANLRLTGLGGMAEVLRADAFKILETPRDLAFDLVYIAPPQYQGLWLQALQVFDAHGGWLAADAEAIVQIDPREEKRVHFSTLQEADRRKYGNTLLIFFGVKP